MRDTLAARGPDDAGTVALDEGRVLLGHRRLAIVDLSPAGWQPMCNETGDIWLTFNGEIYNHGQLRRELERAGHIYRSNCDAESIVHAWEEWGEACVNRFRGIFAFAIWDGPARKLFAARDHLGVKPFYYAKKGSAFMFGSQPKALLAAPRFRAAIDAEAFLDYFSYGVVPHDRAAFAGMKKLPPGHSLTWQDGEIRLNQYWNVQYRPEVTDFSEATRLMRDAIEHSVDLQLMSDVPVGTWLSGGIDSSLITAIARERSGKPIPTLTVGFREKKRDEREFARLVVNYCDTEHTERVLTCREAMRLVDDLIEAHDEPHAPGAALPLQFIAACTRDLGLKVILAGDGADELFAGYLHYDALVEQSRENGLSGPALAPYYRSHEALNPNAKLWRLLGDELKSKADPHWRFRKFFDDSGLPTVTAAQLLDLHSYLPDEILMKVDRPTMAYGVEARVPFLDPALVELAFRIDASIVYRQGERKALLKKAARRWLPDSVLTPRKKGFSIPTLRWMLRPHNRIRMTAAVVDGFLVQSGFLDAGRLRKSCLFLPPTLLWKFYIAERWARRWIDGVC